MSTEFTDLERDALLALRAALDRLRGDGEDDDQALLTSLLGDKFTDLQILMLDTRMFFALHEQHEAEMAESKAEIQRMIDEREAEEAGEWAEVEAELAKPLLAEVPDYDILLAEIEADANRYPHTKVHIQWPDGGGSESVWARDLGNGLALLDNEPLYPKYRWQDIIRSAGGYAGDLVSRTFPTKIVYTFEDVDDKDGSQALRNRLAESLKSLRVHAGFFSFGNAYVLLREGVEPSAVKAALVETGVILTEVQVQTFDVDEDEYTYTDVE